MVLSDAAQSSTWQRSPCLCKPARWAQHGSKCQTQRIFTPACTFCVEKACPGLLSQPLRAAHCPCPSGEVTLSNLAPGVILYPANEKQPDTIQPLPTSSCFQQKSPKNRPGAVQPQPRLLGADGNQAATCGPQPSPLSPAWQSSSLVVEGLGSSFSWRDTSHRIPEAPTGLVLGARQLLFRSCHVILPWVYFKRCI